MLDNEKIQAIRDRLQELRQEHRNLDTTITALSQAVYFDQIQLQRLKKRKLFVKDQIAKLESMLIPNLNA